ncbi:electron transfer flavoprotein subunit alpha/FixB family protein [Lentilactobacillus buchneri]|uniref:electron transfer flavoprotein subunit alpha/FixB family protein n=1 Tax=Lentilactobacillus buchneri TaxID=1581 RepID=UPI0021A76AFC|nr:electron transfer flavoprotein subunit alpha/FixB family protein [Lentilactobacillus buchneri]MCT3555353.1 electron transfer flavoprotein subunit alpha/FixB family protein [Lentilactobacillus buchneri]
MDNNEIWVYVETVGSRIEPTSLQLITKAKAIADGRKVVAVLPEASTIKAENSLQAYGPDRVETLVDDHFTNATDEEIADALFQVLDQNRPNSLLFPATILGRSIAPRLQAKLQTGLTGDCLDIFYENDLLVQVKPTYGDNVMCDIVCPEKRPQMVTVRPNTFRAERVTDSQTKVVKASFTFHKEGNSQIIATDPIINSSSKLDDAKVVIALGRGAYSAKNIQLAQDLAAKLGGMVGVSRPLTDEDEFTHDDQIGIGGASLSADLLINLGISGAVQYTVGIKNAKKIVSVNIDKDAPIFDESDFAYIGDVTDFLTALTAQVR